MFARTVALIALALAATLSASQQAATPSVPQVSGVVRDAITRAPLAGARVRVAAYNPEWCEPCLELRTAGNVTTDRQGRFTIEYAPETFVLEADHTGYSAGGFGVRRGFGRAARIDLAEGQQLADIEILLFREAVVRGRVTDAAGKPMADFEVILTRVDGNGFWRFQYDSEPATEAITDAQGNYTAYAAPGRYAVTVSRDLVPTFHPSGISIHEAELVTLRPGQVRKGVDVRLKPERKAVVHARVAALPGSPPIRFRPSVRLWNESVEIEGQYQDGNIQFVDVPYGNYTLTAESRDGQLADVIAGRPQTLEWWVQVPVRVDQARVGPIDLAPQPPFRVSGTVITPAGQADLMPGVQLRTADQDEIPCGLLRYKDAVVKDGQFDLRARPGQYRLCVWAADRDGGEEATLNGRDVVDLPFTVTQDIRDIQVIVGSPPAHVHGTVRDSLGRPAREGWVVVFPADRSFWPHARKESGYFASARVSIAGAFEIGSLRPGAFMIAAVEDASIEGWPNEAWLARLARGAETVTLGRGNKVEIRSLALRSVPRTPVAPPRPNTFRVSLFDLSIFKSIVQSIATVSVEGIVRDSSGMPAVHAQVTARRDGYNEQVLFTGLDGRYRFGSLTHGLYTLTAEADVPFGRQPVLEGPVHTLPMFVTDIAEVEVKTDKSQVIDLRLSRTRRPSFSGQWTLDEKNSFTTAASQGLSDLGPPAATLDIDHKWERIYWSSGSMFGGPIYQADGTAEEFTVAGHVVTAVSRWQGERLVTRLTVAASAKGPIRTYEESCWMEKNRTMVVEIRGENGAILRRSIYK